MRRSARRRTQRRSLSCARRRLWRRSIRVRSRGSGRPRQPSTRRPSAGDPRQVPFMRTHLPQQAGRLVRGLLYDGGLSYPTYSICCAYAAVRCFSPHMLRVATLLDSAAAPPLDPLSIGEALYSVYRSQALQLIVYERSTICPCHVYEYVDLQKEKKYVLGSL